MAEKKSKKKWMQAAVPKSHEGRFTAKAKAAGETVHAFAKKEKSAGGTIGREANLALTFEKSAHNRKRLRDHYRKG